MRISAAEISPLLFEIFVRREKKVGRSHGLHHDRRESTVDAFEKVARGTRETLPREGILIFFKLLEHIFITRAS